MAVQFCVNGLGVEGLDLSEDEKVDVRRYRFEGQGRLLFGKDDTCDSSRIFRRRGKEAILRKDMLVGLCLDETGNSEPTDQRGVAGPVGLGRRPKSEIEMCVDHTWKDQKYQCKNRQLEPGYQRKGYDPQNDEYDLPNSEDLVEVVVKYLACIHDVCDAKCKWVREEAEIGEEPVMKIA